MNFIAQDTSKLDTMEQCLICLEEKTLIEIKCKHKFCESCITKWNNKNNSCPFCRKPINLTNPKISEDINTDRLNQVIRSFPSELYIYGMKYNLSVL